MTRASDNSSSSIVERGTGGAHDDRRRQRSSKPSDSRIRTSKSASRSPRCRFLPTSPRPPNKEYDLWTDNSLVGDSDFSFF